MNSPTKELKNNLAGLPHGFTAIDVPHGSVTLRNEWTPEVASNWHLKLYVQLIDAYGYQRELAVERVPNRDTERMFWRSHAYQHPGRREILIVSEDVAINFICKFIKQAELYPSLLFNEDLIVDGKLRDARGSGFVRLSEELLRGESLSVEML